VAARKKIARGTRLAVYQRDKWACQYCGRKFQPRLDGYAPMETERGPGGPADFDYVFLEMDHIRPVLHAGTNEMYNLKAACSPCNRRKAAFLGAAEWRAKFTAVVKLLGELEPNERSAEQLISLLVGKPFRMRDLREIERTVTS
jgi:hypothetical protein